MINFMKYIRESISQNFGLNLKTINFFDFASFDIQHDLLAHFKRKVDKQLTNIESQKQMSFSFQTFETIKCANSNGEFAFLK